MIHSLAILALCQCVEFNVGEIYDEIIGTSQQRIVFYERWREHACPNWRTSSDVKWWKKEYERVKQDGRYPGRLIFSSNDVTRRQVFGVAVLYGYTIRINMMVEPIGAISIYYNSFWHAVIMAIILVSIIAYLRHRAYSRCVKRPNSA